MTRPKLIFFVPPMTIGMLVLVAVALVQIGPPRMESFWPISAVAYMTAISQVLMWIGFVAQRKKDDKAPIYKAIDDQTTELKELVSREVGSIRADVERVEKDFAHEIAVAVREINKDMNGLGDRVREVEKEASVAMQGNLTMGDRMTRSEMDRQDLRKEVERNRVEMSELRKEVKAEARMTRKSNRIARAQILAAIAQISAGRSAEQKKT